VIKKLRNTAAGFILLSLLVHFGAVGVLRLTKFTPPTKKRAVEIEIIDASTKDQKKLQLIEQDEKQLNDEVPDEAAYMGRHNQRVVKETKAQHHGDYKNAAGQGQPQPPTEKQVAEKQPPQEQPEKRQAKSKVAEGALPTLGDLKPKFRQSMQRQFDDIPRGQGGDVSKTNDHLKNVDNGFETMLNSREFVYYTYYQRIRGQIRQYWEPSIRAKVRKVFAEGRSIASTRDHITRVIIVLDRNGALQKVQVVGESGVRDLDDAAVDAFRAAEPFPNPPKGLIETDGTIRIQWDFILEA
jgi:TonB family protein